MIKEKIISTLMAASLSVGTICYTYETFRFDNISHIYNSFDKVVEKYEILKENRNELLNKYNDLYNKSVEKINNLENELSKKEEYIKLLEEKLNETNIVEEKETESNNIDDAN